MRATPGSTGLDSNICLLGYAIVQAVTSENICVEHLVAAQEWRQDEASEFSSGSGSGMAAMELNHRKLRLALATMCIGVGQGITIALERD